MATESGAGRANTGNLYSRAMESTQRYISGIRGDQWTSSTPCAEWNVKQIVNHLVGENLWAGELFAGKAVADVGDRLEGDLAGEDPIAAYERSVAFAKRAVEAPGAMEATCHLSFGDHQGAEYAKQLFLDTFIHGWDIAKATGQATRLDSALVSACYPIAEELRGLFGSFGVFGDDLSAEQADDQQTKLLGLMGRRA